MKIGEENINNQSVILINRNGVMKIIVMAASKQKE